MTDRYMTPQEIAREKREAQEREEKLQRELLAATNREEGRAAPKHGDKLVVATAKGLKVRGRAGLAFSPTPTEVKVEDVSDEEIATRQKTGEYVVNLHGAEQIIADSNGDESKGQHRGLFLFSSMAEGRSAAFDSLSDEEFEAEAARRKAKRANPDRITSTNKANREKGEGEKTPSEPKAENNATTKPGDKGQPKS